MEHNEDFIPRWRTNLDPREGIIAQYFDKPNSRYPTHVTVTWQVVRTPLESSKRYALEEIDYNGSIRAIGLYGLDELPVVLEEHDILDLPQHTYDTQRGQLILPFFEKYLT